MDPPTISNSLCRKIVNTTSAPSAIGPYNQAVLVDKTLYISGQLGMNTSGSLVEGGVVKEAEQALENMGHILSAAGGGKDIIEIVYDDIKMIIAGYKDVIKTTVLLKDINKFSEVNNVYSKFFRDHEPARAAFQVKNLFYGILEIL